MAETLTRGFRMRDTLWLGLKGHVEEVRVRTGDEKKSYRHERPDEP